MQCASEIGSQYRPLPMNIQWFSLTHAFAANSAHGSDRVCTSWRGLLLGLLSSSSQGQWYNLQVFTKKRGAESSRTIVQKFLAVRKENSGEPSGYRRSALTFVLLNLSLGDQIKGREKLMSCLGCTRREIQDNLLHLGGGSSTIVNGQVKLPAHLVPLLWPQTRELFLYFSLQCRKLFLSQNKLFVSSTCIFSPVLVLVAFPPCFSFLLPCCFTPGWYKR